jgi:hypothetical protein
MDVIEVFRNKFRTYRSVLDESGEEKARAALFDGYPARQRASMGPMIENHTLAEGFGQAVEIYRQIGMDMTIVDISSDDIDAVLEIQRTCPALEHNLHGEFGVERPCGLICELDVAATEAAFPDIRGDVLARMADGHSVCLFKYQRPRATG